MIDYGAFVNLRDVQNGLRRLQLAGKDLRPVWNRTRKVLRQDQKEHANAQAGPDSAWVPLAKSTLEHRSVKKRKLGRARAKKLPSPRRKLLGRLPGQLDIKYDANRIVGFSRVPWAYVHFKGGRAGHGARMPGRQFYWASNRLLRTVARLTVDYMVGAWDKKA